MSEVGAPLVREVAVRPGCGDAEIARGSQFVKSVTS